MRTRRWTVAGWRALGIAALVLLATAGLAGSAGAMNHLTDCPGSLPGAPASNPEFRLNPAKSGWVQDMGAFSRGGVVVTLTCWYGGPVTPSLSISVTYLETRPQGLTKLPGTCGPPDAPAGLNKNSHSKQVKATWYGGQNRLGAQTADLLIPRFESTALQCPVDTAQMTICNEWDVRLEDHRGTDWLGTWRKVPGSFSYTASWESKSTGQRIQRAVYPMPESPLSFFSEDPGGVRINYYSRRFGSPAYELRGDYEMGGPGVPVTTGSWWARCVDPGPFQRTPR